MTSPEPATTATDTGAATDDGRGLRFILIATVTAGAIGYAIQGLVGAAITPESYLGFSLFWSTMYLVIAALSGLQQEATRATHPVAAGQQPSTIVRFALLVAGLVGLGSLASSPLWGPAAFTTDTLLQVAFLTLGAVSFVCIALLSGLFYGLRLWFAVAAITIVDAVLRLILVGAALLAGASPGLLVAAIVLPFPLSLLIMWLTQRSKIGGRYRLDVTPKVLAWNSLRTVGGAISTGILTSGYPLLIGATSKADPAATVGALMFVVTLTRAPLVVPAMALQSFLTVTFRDRTRGRLRFLLILLGALVAVSCIVAAGAYLLEPWLLHAIWGDKYVVSSAVAGGIVLTAGMTAALCVSGPAALASGRHGYYFAGWAAAAVVAICVILLPLPLEVRTLASMGLGPLVGVAIHVAALLRRSPSEPDA